LGKLSDGPLTLRQRGAQGGLKDVSRLIEVLVIVFAAQAASCNDAPARPSSGTGAADGSSPMHGGPEGGPAGGGPPAPVDAAEGGTGTAAETPDRPAPSADAADGPAEAPEDAPHTSPLEGMGTVELVRGGFDFVEGARWVPALSSYLLSDPYGVTIYMLTPPSQFDPFRMMSNGANALDLDSTGHLVTAECGAMQCQVKGAVTRRGDDGTWSDAIKDYRGLAIQNPNDIAALPDGSLVFSDTGVAHQLLRVDPQGALSYALPTDTGVDTGLNGITLSPRKEVLYVGYNVQRLIRAFDVQPSGLTGMRTVVAMTESTPDGMCVDLDGNLYVGTVAGVQVFDPRSGNLWGVITLPGLGPGDRVSECAFADADAKTLYISAVSKLYRVRLARPGVY
jgi:gluconolactonase